MPMPASVAETDICWPLGIAADAQPQHLCQKRVRAWTLEGAVPPTFPERDARLWNTGIERFQVDANTGKRLSAECDLPHEAGPEEIARWPVLASPWLPVAWRKASQLPPLAADCRDDGREAGESLRIDGINDGATLVRSPGSSGGVRLSLRALGTGAQVQWLLDGRRIGQSDGAAALVHAFDTSGTHELTALADSGAWHSVHFRLLDPTQ
jgi:penicillin-binding protein 1C